MIVQLTDPRTPVNVRQEGNQVVVDFTGALMPKNLMRRYDVMDFATPVQTVEALATYLAGCLEDGPARAW